MPQRFKRTALGSIGMVLVLGAILSAHFYWEYRSFNFLGYPSRLTVHDRRFYDPSHVTISRRQLQESSSGAAPRPVGMVRPIPWTNWGAREVDAIFYDDCPNTAALRVGPDSFVSYSLSGSC